MACECTRRGSATHGPLLDASSHVCAGGTQVAGEGGEGRGGGEGGGGGEEEGKRKGEGERRGEGEGEGEGREEGERRGGEGRGREEDGKGKGEGERRGGERVGEKGEEGERGERGMERYGREGRGGNDPHPVCHLVVHHRQQTSLSSLPFIISSLSPPFSFHTCTLSLTVNSSLLTICCPLAR